MQDSEEHSSISIDRAIPYVIGLGIGLIAAKILEATGVSYWISNTVLLVVAVVLGMSGNTLVHDYRKNREDWHLNGDRITAILECLSKSALFGGVVGYMLVALLMRLFAKQEVFELNLVSAVLAGVICYGILLRDHRTFRGSRVVKKEP